MPSTARPPDTTSVVVMLFASVAGWRMVIGLTSGPMRTRSVVTASAASRVRRVGDRRVRAAVVADVADGALHHVVGEPQRVERRRLDGRGDLHEVREEAV